MLTHFFQSFLPSMRRCFALSRVLDYYESLRSRHPSSRKNRCPHLLLEALEQRAIPAVVTWIQAGSGDWSNPANWSPNRVPGSSDDVFVNNSAVTVRLANNSTVRSLNVAGTLQLDSGTLTLRSTSSIRNLNLVDADVKTAGNLTLLGTFNWIDGTLSGNGSVSNRGLLNWTGTEDKKIDQLTLSNFGTINWTGGRIKSSSSGTLTNVSGGTVNVQVSNSFAPRFNNLGLVQFAQNVVPLNATFATFNNAGTLAVNNGKLTSSNFTQTAGSMSLLGGMLTSNNSVNLAGGQFAGFGVVNATIKNTGAALTLNAGGILQVRGNYFQSGGSLNLTLPGLPSFPALPQVFMTVSGLASLGGVLDLTPTTAFLQSPTTAVASLGVLTAGFVLGTFSDVTSSSPIVSFDPRYTLNSVSIVAKPVAAEFPVINNSLTTITNSPPLPVVNNIVTLGNNTQITTAVTTTQASAPAANPLVDSLPAITANTIVTTAVRATLTTGASGATTFAAATFTRGSTTLPTSTVATQTTTSVGVELMSSIGATSFAPGLLVSGSTGDPVRTSAGDIDASSQFVKRTNPQVNYFGDKAPTSRSTDSSGDSDLFGSFPLALPELELPSEAELHLGIDFRGLLPAGTSARAGIVQQGGNSVSVVATLVGEVESPTQTNSVNDSASLSDLLFLPLSLGDASGLTSHTPSAFLALPPTPAFHCRSPLPLRSPGSTSVQPESAKTAHQVSALLVSSSLSLFLFSTSDRSRRQRGLGLQPRLSAINRVW